MNVRLAGERDEAFVMDSWLRSFRPSWFAGPIPNNRYYDWMREIVMGIRSRPGAKTYVAVSPDDDDVILAFACVEPPGIIHYVYTKDVFRKHGVATRLVEAAGIRAPGEYTMRTQDGVKALLGKNFIFNPFKIRDVARGDR